MKSKIYELQKIKFRRAGKKLLLVLLCAFSVCAFSQATAYQPANLSQCGVEVFDLTSQNVVILGNQSPAQFTVSYFLSQADADNNVGSISNPAAFIAQQSVATTIYARVDNTEDGSFATTSFTIIWHALPSVTLISGNVVGCGAYVLPPPLPGSGYFADAAATVPLIPAVVTTSMTVYSYAENSYCSNIGSFYVTINPVPTVVEMPDITVCGSWTTEPLPSGQNYYTGPGGTGEILPAGFALTTSMTIYIFAQTGDGPDCTAESSFVLTVLSPPVITPMNNIVSCTPVALPELPAGSHYFNGPMGTGGEIVAGETIFSSQDVYIFAESGTNENCIAESVFHVTIGDAPLPIQQPLVGCDSDLDGYAQFDLNALIPGLVNGNPNLAVSFYETLTDAQIGLNPLSSPYLNIVPLQQTIYIRLNLNDGECFSIGELPLQTGLCGAILGTVSFDYDADGCDAGDGVLENIHVIATAGNIVHHSYTDANGQYSFAGLPEETHTIYVGQNSVGIATPNSQIVTVTPAGVTTVDFCIQPIATVNDLEVYFWPMTAARPGFGAVYQLQVRNYGNSVQSGVATLGFDEARLNFTDASIPVTFQSDGLLTFNFTDIPAGGIAIYTIWFMVEAPPVANGGDVLEFAAQVSSPLADATPENNVRNINQTIVNSFDPNDKTVLQQVFLADDTQNYLQYVVRFQNTGTAEAVNVRITDQLDENLDWNTFRPVSASHAYQTQMDQDGLVTFTFNNINLPDSTTSEPDSHGFVAYEVKLKPGLTVNDDIYNTANIYFDFNAPIITNTAVTDLVELLGVGEHRTSVFAMYPNPAGSTVSIDTNGAFAVQVFDIQGKLVLENRGDNSAVLNVSMLQSGMYFVKVTTDNASEVKKLLVK